jgi:hypothetical protein
MKEEAKKTTKKFTNEDKAQFTSSAASVLENVSVACSGATVVGFIAKIRPLQVVGSAATFASLAAMKVSETLCGYFVDKAMDEADDRYEEGFDDLFDDDDDDLGDAPSADEVADEEANPIVEETNDEDNSDSVSDDESDAEQADA